MYQSIRGWPELVQCWSLSGENDMLVQVRCADNDGIERLRDRMTRHPEVVRAVTFMVLNEWIKRPAHFHLPEEKSDQFMVKLLGEMNPLAMSEAE